MPILCCLIYRKSQMNVSFWRCDLNGAIWNNNTSFSTCYDNVILSAVKQSMIKLGSFFERRKLRIFIWFILSFNSFLNNLWEILSVDSQTPSVVLPCCHPSALKLKDISARCHFTKRKHIISDVNSAWSHIYGADWEFPACLHHRSSFKIMITTLLPFKYWKFKAQFAVLWN